MNVPGVSMCNPWKSLTERSFIIDLAITGALRLPGNRAQKVMSDISKIVSDVDRIVWNGMKTGRNVSIIMITAWIVQKYMCIGFLRVSIT
jgi:predicted cation transporter